MGSPLRRSTSDMAAAAALKTPTRRRTLCRHRKSYSDGPSPCPSLLSEHVDEAVERFMTLPSPPIKTPFFFGKERTESLPEFSRTRKRNLFDEDDERRTYESGLARRQRSGPFEGTASLFSSSLDDSPPLPPRLTRNDRIFNDGNDELKVFAPIVDEQYKNLSPCKPSSRKQWPPASPENVDSLKAPAQHKVSIEQDEFVPLPNFLRTNTHIIEEQKVLMEQIRRDQYEKKQKSSNQDEALAHQEESSTKASTTTSKAKALENKIQQHSKPIAVGIPSNHKNCVEVYPGQNIRIADRSRAMAALRENTAGVFRCAGCEVLLVASKDSKVLFCSDCGTLTPTSLSGNLRGTKTKE